MNVAALRRGEIQRLLGGSPVTGPFISLIAIFVLFGLFIPGFLSLRTVSNIINATTMVGTVTIGVTLLMVSGEFDLSVGALVAAGGYLFAFNSTGDGSPVVALVLAVLIPGLLGAFNGAILITTRMPSLSSRWARGRSTAARCGCSPAGRCSRRWNTRPSTT
ncbi:MAG: hypothetical protein Kow00120_20020 [Anaerolineae bacterium]